VLRNLWLPLLVVVSGCAAAKASIHLVIAETALSRAADQGAPTRAPYEYTMAERYLQKAKEEHAEADYRVAEVLSRASADWSDQAVITIEARGRADIDLTPLQDAAMPAPPAPGEVTPEPPPEPKKPSEYDEFETIEEGE
jgi:hypothetical protein